MKISYEENAVKKRRRDAAVQALHFTKIDGRLLEVN